MLDTAIPMESGDVHMPPVILQAQFTALSLASASSCEVLTQYYFSNQALLRETILDIMTYIPESTDPQAYIALLRSVQTSNDSDSSSEEAKENFVPSVHFDTSDMHTTMCNVRLRSLTIEEFLYERVLQIDHTTGLVGQELKLLDLCPDVLSEWRVGIIKPLLVLQTCGIYTDIKYLESVSLDYAIATILGSSQDKHLELAIEEILIPWSKYRQLSVELCRGISDRMASSTAISLRGVLRTLSCFLQADLERPEKEVVASGAMLACYKKPLLFDGIDHTVERQTIVALLSNSFTTDSSSLPDLNNCEFRGFSSLELYMQDSASDLHRLILPSRQSINLLKELIDASEIFGSIRLAVEARLCDSKTQKEHLARLLRTTRSDVQIGALRETLSRLFFLPKLSKTDVESVVLRNLLLSGHYDFARKTYITASPRPLTSAAIEQILLEAFQELFDNAKSLTRKDLGAASKILAVIHPKHLNDEIRRRQLLVDTLIELSTYQGSGQYLPIQIKAFTAEEILEMFSRILQETSNYKKHFRLLGLYQNLSLSLQSKASVDRYRELVVNSALSFDDLNFALDQVDEVIESLENDTDRSAETHGDQEGNGAWRLIYLVCKYPTEDFSVAKRQIALLSHAIAICPPENIQQLLTLYARLEKNVFTANQSLLTIKDGSANSRPNDFSMSAQKTTIEMPQWRLFEAAQAATQAAKNYLPKTDAQATHGNEGRVRKRDQIVGLVGSGVGAVESRFTSGLGWIRMIIPETHEGN